MSDETPEVKPSPRPLCPARWGREKGYIAVRDPFSGETVEIPYQQATDVWKSDIRNARRG